MYMKKVLFVLFVLVQTFIFSQVVNNDNNQFGCASSVFLQNSMDNNLKMNENNEKINAKWIEYAKNNNFSLKRATTDICIVFNVLSSNKNFDLTHAIKLTKELNNIFSTLNTTNINFKLAEINDNKQKITENSIFYNAPSEKLNISYPSELTTWTDVIQKTNNLPTTKYINIYLVDNLVFSYIDPKSPTAPPKEIPTNSFATMPSMFKTLHPEINYQGIFLKMSLFDKNSLKLENMMYFAHEMGHYLGLYDTYGICVSKETDNSYSNECGCFNDICYTDGDKVCDTPPTKIINSVPNGTQNSCSTDKTWKLGDQFALVNDVPDLLNNYMHNYTKADVSVNKFTPGQIKRISFFFDKVDGVLNTLITANNCSVECASDCKLIIKTIENNITDKTSPFYKANVLLTPKLPLSYTFTTGNTCNYSKITWTLLNLATNTSIQNATGKFSLSTTGNYRISLEGTNSAQSGVICSQKATSIDFQVLNTAACTSIADNAKCCIGNLYLNTWNYSEWSRIKYENGWAREDDGTFTNKNGISVNGVSYESTKFSVLNKTVVDDNFEILTVNDLALEKNSKLSASTKLNPGIYNKSIQNNTVPVNLTQIFRVGKIFNDVNKYKTMKRGDASYVTYTFKPTRQNAKIRVYYFGVKESNEQGIEAYDKFTQNVPQGAGYGVICEYTFKSIDPTKTSLAHRGTLHTGITGNKLAKNDLYVSGNNGRPFLTDDGRPAYVSDNWSYKDLDFTDFICNDATITLTFFARTNNASDLGFMNCYAYFGVQCFPGENQNVDLNLPNVTTPCETIAGDENRRDLPSEFTLKLPSISILSTGESTEDLLDVSTRVSNDKNTLKNKPFGNNHSSPVVNLISSATEYSTAFPYQYTEVKYKTACKEKTQIVSFIHDFRMKYKPCENDKLHGGKLTGDKYIEFCDSVKITYTPPCWLTQSDNKDTQQEYSWSMNGEPVKGATGEKLVLKKENFKGLNDKCIHVVRYATIRDDMCNLPSYIASEEYIVTCLGVLPMTHKTVGPNVCAKSETSVIIKELSEKNLTCDPYFEKYFKQHDANYTMTIKLFKDPQCTLPIYTCAKDGDKGIKETTTQCMIENISFHNGLGSTATSTYTGPYTSSTPLNFINDSYVEYFIYAQVTTTRKFDGCPVEATVLPIWIPIKPSSIPGTIGNFRTCTNEDVVVYDVVQDPDDKTKTKINNNDPMKFNLKNYDWEYKVTEASGNTPATWAPLTKYIITNKSYLNFNLHISYSDFTTLLKNKNNKLTVRRLSPGTVDCPQRFYSNELVLTPMKTGVIDANALTKIVCFNTQDVILQATKKSGETPITFFSTTNNPLQTTTPVLYTDPMVSLTAFKNVNQSNVGKIEQKTTYYVIGQYQIDKETPAAGCYSDPIKIEVDVKKLEGITIPSKTPCQGDKITLSTTTDLTKFNVTTVLWEYSYTDKDGKIVTGKYTANINTTNNTFTYPDFIINYTTTFKATATDADGCSNIVSITVNVNLPGKLVNVQSTTANGNVVVKGDNYFQVYLCGTDIQTTITPSFDLNGKPNFTYQWYTKGINEAGSEPAINKEITTSVYPAMKYVDKTTGQNTHYLDITDQNGCKSTGIVELIKLRDFTPTITKSTEILCFGTPVKLTALVNKVINTSDYSYNWSTKETTNAIFVNRIGIWPYTVTVTNNTSKCTKSISETVTKIKDITVSAVADICPEEEKEVTITPNTNYKPTTKVYWSDDATPYKFWINTTTTTPGPIKIKIKFSSSKTYTVTTVDNSGCVITKPISVNYKSTPDITFSSENASRVIYDDATKITTITTNCLFDKVDVTATGNGTPKINIINLGVPKLQEYYKFTWTPATIVNNGLAKFSKANSVAIGNNYQVSIEDKFCSVTKNFNVVQGPDYDFEVNDITVCPGERSTSKVNIFYTLNPIKPLTGNEIKQYTITVKPANTNYTYTQSTTDPTIIDFSAGTFEITVDGPCGKKVKTITVKITCDKGTFTSNHVINGWKPKTNEPMKADLRTCQNVSVNKFESGTDATEKFSKRFPQVAGVVAFENCMNYEIFDFVFPTNSTNLLNTKVYYQNTCKPVEKGYYLYNNLKRASSIYGFELNECGVIINLFSALTGGRSFNDVDLGPQKYIIGKTKPIGIEISPNPNTGKFNIIIDNAVVKNYFIEVYDMQGKLIHNQNMYDEISGGIATQIDLTDYNLAKGLYTIRTTINNEINIKKIEIE